MKAKRIKLEIPNEQAAFYALSCSDPIHKIAWHINSIVALNLKDYEGIEFDGQIFPKQKDDTSIPETIFTIVKNRIEAYLLIKELPNVDYIIKVEGNMPKEKQKEMLGLIKKISSVTAVIEIDPSRIKNLSRLKSY
jgi:hypothetical protein